jgi:hypothetical protein
MSWQRWRGRRHVPFEQTSKSWATVVGVCSALSEPGRKNRRFVTGDGLIGFGSRGGDVNPLWAGAYKGSGEGEGSAPSVGAPILSGRMPMVGDSST